MATVAEQRETWKCRREKNGAPLAFERPLKSFDHPGTVYRRAQVQVTVLLE
ncbi:hypothetical protein [Cryobacterium sp. PH29-G1]|uniref:hypothetical protein n=1 Tax=Cryobacterium sp. PH29-G1 TaxID=3046211 RepID=UPI0024BAEE32|nr:hypothetical protein [Cryobacterium sp. PH29-G1]MDJ0349895.1 hypothetical protein [Cryobacterium sp. PH29-G1]